MNISAMIKHPSAYIPIAMSLTALAMLLWQLSIAGPPAPEADEGATAHIWQILMAAQIPLVGFFAFKWLPRDRSAALSVLALQAVAILAAAAPVFLLGL